MASKCVITGSNGYVGSVLKSSLGRQGYSIIELRRLKPGESAAANTVPFSLGEKINPESLKGIDILIHCAYDFRQYRENEIWRVNVAGSERLLDAAVQAGVSKIILISTMSAFENCRSLYGKAKLEIETLAAKRNAIIIRPGLVYGPQPGGMVGSLQKAVMKSSLVPIIGTGNFPFYLTHQDDLAELVKKACEGRVTSGQPISAVSEKKLLFSEILKILAKAKNKSIILLPVPTFPVWLLLRTLERLGLPAGFRSDSLVSLLHQNLAPSFELTRKIGVAFREFSPQTLQS